MRALSPAPRQKRPFARPYTAAFYYNNKLTIMVITYNVVSAQSSHGLCYVNNLLCYSYRVIMKYLSTWPLRCRYDFEIYHLSNIVQLKSFTMHIFLVIYKKIIFTNS